MDRAECLLSLLKSMRVPQAPRGTMLRETRFFSTRFFEDVRSDRVRLCDFREMQKRFFFAVVYVTRPMAVLVSRIDEQSKRMLVLENIVEEHGHGCYEKSHESTFLASIGCRLDIAEPPEVRASTLVSWVCACDDVRTAAACLGILEYAFSTISQIIGSHVCKMGWAVHGTLHHYSVHSVLDIQHSADLFSIVDVSRCPEDICFARSTSRSTGPAPAPMRTPLTRAASHSTVRVE